MIHVRAVSPPEVTSTLVETLVANPGVSSIVVLEHAARGPDGDAVQFDVITVEANREGRHAVQVFQLLLNIVLLIVVGVIVMRFQRRGVARSPSGPQRGDLVSVFGDQYRRRQL